MSYRLIFESSLRRNGAEVTERAQRAVFEELPDVPVLPETVLLMELKAQEPTAHLQALAQAALCDLGATLQIFRTAGDYGVRGTSHARSVEECVIRLGARGCVEAVTSRTQRFGARKHAVQETWAHARKIATYCRLVSADFATGVAPEEVYLVGLFHELGSLPAVLGWATPNQDMSESGAAGLRIAEEWSLPWCVQEYFCELQAPGMRHRWQSIVDAAHELASMPRIESCLSAGLSVQAPACA